MSPQTSPTRTATRRIKPGEALAGIYVDFEGRKNGDPVLLGILWNAERNGTGPWSIEQVVMDPEMQEVDEATGATCTALSIEAAISSVLDRSDAERRHLISWSEHDRNILKRISGDRAFRYRNAIRTARGWRYREETAGTITDSPQNDDAQRNALRRYETFIGYDRPAERYDVGDSIRYIRELKSVTPGAVDRWNTILIHNRHDLLAMRDITFTVLGLDQPE